MQGVLNYARDTTILVPVQEHDGCALWVVPNGANFVSQKIIRVVIAEDHPVVRQAIMLTLETEPDIKVLTGIGSGRKALNACQELKPDVLILDLKIPDMDGLQVLTALASEHERPATIVLTSFTTPLYFSRALALGAKAFLSKDMKLKSLPAVVRKVVEGKAVMDRPIGWESFHQLQSIRDGGENEGDSAISVGLTSEQLQMLRMLAKGMNSAEIGDKLLISPRTARSRLAKLYERIGVDERTQAVLWAIRERIVSL